MNTLITKLSQVKTHMGIMLGSLMAGFSLAFINVSLAAPSRDTFGVQADSGIKAVSGTELDKIVLNTLNTIFILLGFLAVVFIIYAGIKLITSKGNEAAMKDAQKLLTNAFLGFGLIILSYAIVRFIVSFFVSTTSGDTPVEEINFK